jgi:hypothetical protein
LQKILNEIDTQIKTLEGNNDYSLPSTGEPEIIIRDYLTHQQEQRVNIQRQQDLRDLREMVQTEIKGIDAEADRKGKLMEAETRTKYIVAETAKAIKQLSKMDLCSPEAANALLTLTKIRR